MNARRLADLIEGAIEPTAPPVAIKELIEKELRKSMGEVGAWEEAERLEPAVFRELERRRVALLEEEDDSSFEFNSSSPRMLQGACYSEPREAEEVREARLRRGRWLSVLNWIRRLSFRDFETLCARLVKLLGARYAVQTRQTADQGIDFYGLVNLADFGGDAVPFVRFEAGFGFWIVGQAKHFPDRKVGTDLIRDLVGATALARAKAFGASHDLFGDMDIRVCSPAVILFVTSGHFTNDARILAAKSGVVCKPGSAVAKFLADRGIGIEQESGEFSEELARQWLEQS